MTDEHICPACGFTGLSEEPYSASGGGSYEICDCCGFEYGYTDDDQGFTFESWRQKWIEAGMPWGWNKYGPAPAGWDPEAQLARLR